MNFRRIACSSSLLVRLTVVGVAWAVATSAIAAEVPNLVKDGGFETAVAGAALPAGWSLTGPGKAAIDPKLKFEGKQALRIDSPVGKVTKLKLDVAVEPNVEYLFTIDVKSDDRLVVTADTLRMAYNRQGQWQRIAGLVRSGSKKSITITFDASSLGNKPAVVHLDSVTLRPFQAPKNLSRRYQFPAQTSIVAQGKPTAAIVYPASVPAYHALAQRVQQAIVKQSGVTLPIVSDVDATAADAPVLKDAYANQNLILLGRLGINRAMWPAYNRMLDATDGYYPGGDGYVVRTASDVLHNGKDHLILGGSTDAGAAKAIERFEQSLSTAKASDGTLALPWLLDVQLDGACRDAFKDHDGRWSANPLAADLPPIEPGYGTIRRWYENAMGWYWTGWDSYKQRAQSLVKPVLDDKAYVHHYITEFWVHTYDMVDETGLLTPEQRAELDRQILTNFRQFNTPDGDMSWMTLFSPPYDQVFLVNRHQISPWMADLTMAAYLQDSYALSGDLKTLVDFRREEKDRFMHHMVTERWDASVPGGFAAEVEEETALTLFRYALVNQVYDFFDSGNARRTVSVPKINHVDGRWVRPAGSVFQQGILGAVATYHKDGRYLALSRKLAPGTPFMNRYICGVGRYASGAELVEADPRDLAGVQLPPTQPHNQRNFARLENKKFAWGKYAPDDVFDFASMRSGFGCGDDYVAFTGLAGQGMPGELLCFTTGEMTWFTGSSSNRYFDHNALHVLRTDRWDDAAKPYAAAARLDWSANLQTGGGLGFTMDPFVGTTWQRSVAWVRPGLYLVRDRVTAKEAGDYQIAVNWHPAGGPSFDGKNWTSISRTGSLRLTPLGRAFQIRQNVEAFTAGQEAAAYLRQTADVTLAKDQSLAAIMVLQGIHSASAPAMQAVELEDGSVLLWSDQDPRQRVLVAWGSSRVGQVETDGHAVVLEPGIIQVLGATRLTLAGQSVLEAQKPLSIRVEWNNGQVIADNAAERQSIRLAGADGQLGAPITLEAGVRRIELPKASARTMVERIDQTLERAIIASNAAAASSPTAAASNHSAPAIADQSTQWKQQWQYDGLQQPLPVEGVTAISDDVIDLGREVEIEQIRLSVPPRTWIPLELPAEIWTAPAGPSGQPPAADSPAWKRIEQKAQWRPGVETGNYGRAERVERDNQILRLDAGITARYIRAAGAKNLVILDRKTRGIEQPLTLIVRPGQNGEQPAVVAAPDPWPWFVGKLRTTEYSVALLGADGSQRFRHTSPYRVQKVDVLPVDGKPRVVVTTADARIQIFSDAGTVEREIDGFAAHEGFRKEFGRPNTRHPAAGYTLPFAVGLWKPAKDAVPGWIMTRYGAMTFFDSAGKLDGVLQRGSYPQPEVLPEGIDFDGDGAQEQVVLARGNVMKVYGPRNPRVEEPSGDLFYPQVYQADRLAEPDWYDHINGAPVKLFQPLPTAGADGRFRFLAIVRENYLGIYDGLEHKWAFSWVPLVNLRSAAVVEATSSGALRMLAITEDDLLWDLRWEKAALSAVTSTVQQLPEPIHQVSADLALPGRAVLAGPRGLYVWHATQPLARIAGGTFTAARMLGADAVVAVTRDGLVRKYESQPAR